MVAMNKIPISVLVVTKNEERVIERCLKALQDFDEVIVVDSSSDDNTVQISKNNGAKPVLFQWNGQYPKKRQWCLQQLEIRHSWVFWVDADEVVMPDLIAEIRHVFSSPPTQAGFFVKGNYVWREGVLKHGMKNNKLALFNRLKMEFPVVDDLDIDGMGEVEGHYQPVFKAGCKGEKIGQLQAPLLHYAYEDEAAWHVRHERYAVWEAQMTRRKSFPKDPIVWREFLKTYIRTSIFRPYIMFLYSYVFKLGFLDGRNGFDFALSRKTYCDLIRKHL